MRKRLSLTSHHLNVSKFASVVASYSRTINDIYRFFSNQRVFVLNNWIIDCAYLCLFLSQREIISWVHMRINYFFLCLLGFERVDTAKVPKFQEPQSSGHHV